MPPAQCPPPLWPHSAHGTVASSGMPALRTQVGQRFLKRHIGAIARITPQLAIGLVRLLIRRRQQGAVVFARERLPMQIERARQTGLARALAAAVLVNDEAAQRFYAGRNPHREVRGKDQLAGLGRSLAAHAIIGRIGRRKNIVGWLLGRQRTSEDEEEKSDLAHGARQTGEARGKLQARAGCLRCTAAAALHGAGQGAQHPSGGAAEPQGDL